MNEVGIARKTPAAFTSKSFEDIFEVPSGFVPTSPVIFETLFNINPFCPYHSVLSFAAFFDNAYSVLLTTTFEFLNGGSLEAQTSVQTISLSNTVTAPFTDRLNTVSISLNTQSSILASEASITNAIDPRFPFPFNVFPPTPPWGGTGVYYGNGTHVTAVADQLRVTTSMSQYDFDQGHTIPQCSIYHGDLQQPWS